MPNTRTLRTTAVSLTALFLLSVALPAQAQEPGTAVPKVTLDTPDVSYTLPSGASGLKPQVGQAKIDVDWEFIINDPGFFLAGNAYPSTLLKFNTVNCQGGTVTVTGSGVAVVDLAPEGTESQLSDSGTVTYIAVADQNAPGETSVKCTFSATSDAVGSQIESADSNNVDATVYISYLGLISASVPGTIKQASPQKQITYDLDITNLGNARSYVNFELANDEREGWEPVLPTAIVLQSEAQGGSDTSKVVGFTVQTPYKNGWNNKDTTFTIRLTPQSTQDSESVGQPLDINVLARVRGVYVPSLEPMLLLGAILGTALLARMTRQ